MLDPDRLDLDELCFARGDHSFGVSLHPPSRSHTDEHRMIGGVACAREDLAAAQLLLVDHRERAVRQQVLVTQDHPEFLGDVGSAAPYSMHACLSSWLQ